jgi:hypothetical protein
VYAGTQALQHTGQLQRDVPRTLHHHPLGQGLQIEEAIGVYGKLMAFYVASPRWCCAGCYQNMTTAQPGAVGQHDRVAVLQLCPPRKNLYPGGQQVVAVNALQSKRRSPSVQPKPAASSNSCAKREA